MTPYNMEMLVKFTWIDEDDAPELDAAFFASAIYRENNIENPNPFRKKQTRVDLALKEWLEMKCIEA